MKYRTHFHSLTTAHAIAVFMGNKKQFNISKLNTLLYFLDRECILESNYSVTGSSVKLTSDGFLLVEFNAAIKFKVSKSWEDFFSVSDDTLSLISHPGDDNLSKYIIGKIEKLNLKYENYTAAQLFEVSRKLPEWKNQRSKLGKEMDLIKIFELEGYCPSQICYLASENNSYVKFYSLFNTS